MRSVRAATLVLILALVTGSANAEAGAAERVGATVTTVERSDGGRCTLLAEAEVRSAIGPRDGGQSGAGDWGNMGCRWAADRVQDISGLPPWRDAIEVAQFDAARTEWAREQCDGTSGSRLRERCVVRRELRRPVIPVRRQPGVRGEVRAASSDGREESAIRRARLVNERV